MKLLPIWKVIAVDCWNGLQIIEWLQIQKIPAYVPRLERPEKTATKYK